MKIFLAIQAVIVYFLIGAVVGTVICAVDEDGDMDSVDTKGFIGGMAFIWPVMLVLFLVVALCHIIYNQILRPIYTIISGPKEERNNLKTCSEKLDEAFDTIARVKADDAKLQMEEFKLRASLEQWPACPDCPLWDKMCKDCDDLSDRLFICQNRNSFLDLVGGNKDD